MPTSLEDFNNNNYGNDGANYTTPTNDGGGGSSGGGGGIFGWIGSIGSTLGMLFGRNNTGSTQPKYDTSATDQTARLAKTMFIGITAICVIGLIIFFIVKRKK